MPAPGTLANVASAICSFFIPGLGQLVQGRVWAAFWQFILTAILWIFFLGWIMHFWSILDAALYKGNPRDYEWKARRYRYDPYY